MGWTTHRIIVLILFNSLYNIIYFGLLLIRTSAADLLRLRKRVPCIQAVHFYDFVNKIAAWSSENNERTTPYLEQSSSTIVSGLLFTKSEYVFS